MIQTLKDNGDGTFLGADENGVLYNGVLTLYGADETTKVIVSQANGRTVFNEMIGDNIIGHGDVETENFQPTNAKVFRDTFDENGQPNGQVEVKRSTINWTVK